MTQNLQIDIRNWEPIGFKYKNKSYPIHMYKDILLGTDDWDSINNVLTWCRTYMVKTTWEKDSNGINIAKYGPPWYQYRIMDEFKTIMLDCADYYKWFTVLNHKYSININGGKS